MSGKTMKAASLSLLCLLLLSAASYSRAVFLMSKALLAGITGAYEMPDGTRSSGSLPMAGTSKLKTRSACIGTQTGSPACAIGQTDDRKQSIGR
jgi:hypothetical protein